MDKKFLIDVVYGTSLFLEGLIKQDNPSYFPASKGLTKYGKKLNLGFTCYGVKLNKLNGQWENLSKAKRDAFINYIYSFHGIIYTIKITNISNNKINILVIYF